METGGCQIKKKMSVLYFLHTKPRISFSTFPFIFYWFPKCMVLSKRTKEIPQSFFSEFSYDFSEWKQICAVFFFNYIIGDGNLQKM